MTRIVVNLEQLREALRVAEEHEVLLRDVSETDSVQIHLTEPEEAMLRVELWSNENGQPEDCYTIDPGQAPGETGRAEQVAL